MLHIVQYTSHMTNYEASLGEEAIKPSSHAVERNATLPVLSQRCIFTVEGLSGRSDNILSLFIH